MTCAQKTDRFRRQHVLWRLLSTLFVSLLFALPASAQTDARVVGNIRDQSGAFVAGATLTVVNEGTGDQRTAVSNADGFAVVPSLRPALYTVRVTSPNFAEIEYKGMKLSAAQEL